MVFFLLLCLVVTPYLNCGKLVLHRILTSRFNVNFDRTSLQVAEVEREGGISPHVSPMTGRYRLHMPHRDECD